MAKASHRPAEWPRGNLNIGIPMFHRLHESIEAHLTIVFTALAVSRYLQRRGGVSIKYS